MSTANTMRPALQVIKMQPGFGLISSVFFMMLRDKVYVYADCAINVDPSAEELAEIAVASARTARTFGVIPRVAMLSYATGDSNQGPMIDKVRKATALAQERAPDELIEGPFQVRGEARRSRPRRAFLERPPPSQIDAAVDPGVAAIKAPAQPRRGPRDRLHLPRPQRGEQRLQGGAAGDQDERDRPRHAGAPHARQRPLARRDRRGHRQHRRLDARAPGAGRRRGGGGAA